MVSLSMNVKRHDGSDHVSYALASVSEMCPRRPNKEDVRVCDGTHTWFTEYCRICTLCRLCTGFADCHCNAMPIRVPGE